MRRIILAITVAAVTVATTALTAGSALPQGESDPSCFGEYSRSTSPEPQDAGPGSVVVGNAAQSLGQGQGTDDVAKNFVGPVNQSGGNCQTEDDLKETFCEENEACEPT